MRCVALVAVVLSGAGRPADGAAQDTASAARTAWIGIRFELGRHVAPRAGPATYDLVVRDVYGNGPADRVGIRPGDRLVAVNGNRLSAYEVWLRSTSNLGPGQILSVRLLRDSGEREVAVVAGRRPRSLHADPLYRPEWEVARARFDSLFDLFLRGGPRVLQWPENRIPQTEPPEVPDTESTVPGTAVENQGAKVGSDLLAASGGEAGEALARPRRSGPDGRVETAPERRGRVRHAAADAISLPTPRPVGGTVAVVLGGAVVRDLTAGLGRYFGVEAGVLVADIVDAATPAAHAGFRPGDIIVSVEGRRVQDVPAFRRVLAEEDPPLEITVIRRGNPVRLAYPSR